MTELTKKELEDIEAQAQLEAEQEEKDEAKAEALAEAKENIKRKKAKAKEASKTPKKGTRNVLINLAKHSDRLVVDGKTYMHGTSYPLTHAEEASIKDMAFRTHLHQAEIKGGKFLSDFYGKRSANATI